MFNKILVAIDQSQISQQVLDEALSLATATGANLMLLHVISPLDEQYVNPMFLHPNTMYSSIPPEAVKTYMKRWEELKQERLDWLRSLFQKATDAGVKAELSQILGNPSRMICEVARNWQADLIVVGHRGLSGLSEFVLGSVSNYLLHHAPCSILTVQPKATHTTTENPQTALVATF
ncbi:MAG: universal stress protein [Heteroscytonema crispum UTEX LB 1556]